jgi:hypothetical protein
VREKKREKRGNTAKVTNSTILSRRELSFRKQEKQIKSRYESVVLNLFSAQMSQHGVANEAISLRFISLIKVLDAAVGAPRCLCISIAVGR